MLAQLRGQVQADLLGAKAGGGGEKTTKERIGKINKLLVYSFWVYNKSGELMKRRGRNKKMVEEHPFDPIDPIELYYHS